MIDSVETGVVDVILPSVSVSFELASVFSVTVSVEYSVIVSVE